MKTKPTAADKAANATAVQERRKQVAAYHLARWTQQDIAAKLGVGDATISRDLDALRKGWAAEARADIAQATARELAVLDNDESTWRARMQKAEKPGDRLGIYDRIFRIMERRAKLLGLDAPTKQDVTTGGAAIQIITVTPPAPPPDAA
jgi:hypothetical protein